MKKINLFNRNTNLPSYRRRPVSGGFNRGGGIPLFSGMTAVIFALFVATPSFATPTELDKKTVASKAYVDTKQDIITTGLVTFYDDDNDSDDIYVPGLVAYDSTTGSLKGNKIGILDQETIADDEGGLAMYNTSEYGDEMDNFVPTVRAVADGLHNIWNNMPDSWTALTWNSAETASTNAYDITFVGDPGATANAWPWADRTKLINTAALAQGLALKQNKIPVQNTNLVIGQQVVNGVPSSVIAPTATAGVVQQVALWDAYGLDPASWNINELSNDNAERSAIRQSIPTVGAVEAGLNTKQDEITTGLVTFHDPDDGSDYTVPALVSYGTGTNNSDGVLGNKIGILGINVNGGGLYSWEFLDLDNDSESAYLDNFVPTVRAVANSIQRLYWNGSTHSNAINAYSTSFAGTTNNWPSDNLTQLVNGNTFAQGLALKQNKLPRQTTTTNYVPKGAQTITLATSANGAPGTRYITAGGSVGLTTKSDAPAIIGYVNGTAVTDSTAMTTFTTGTFGSNNTTNQNYIKNALVSLELLKDVYSELNTKITNNALPTGTTGTVVTYNGTNATTGVQEFTETAIASAATYDANDQLSNGNSIANVTLVETKQTKRVCGGYEPGHENDPDYCWLWDFPD